MAKLGNRILLVTASVSLGLALSFVRGASPAPVSGTFHGKIARTSGVDQVRVPGDPLQAPGSARDRALGSGPGYVYLTQRLIGETPKGLHVWVLADSSHRGTIAKYAAGSVRTLRRLGLDVHWQGFGRPELTTGVVTLRESPAGCSDGPNVIGMTWSTWNRLSNGDLYTDHAEIALCPTLFSNYGPWVSRAAIHHELGHAMGLGHMNSHYHGSYQVMNAVTNRGVSTYRAGDRNGLRRLARQARQVRNEIGPIGRFDNSSQSADVRTFTGWALLQYGKALGVRIRLTDNGTVVRRAATTVLRPDVNSQYDPGDRRHGFSISLPAQSGKHTYCVTAASILHPVAKSQLGCVTWGG